MPSDNLSFDQLTPAQQRDFERAVLDGRLSSALTPWEPWWNAGSKSAKPEGMSLPPDLPPVESVLNGRAAADTLPFHLVQIM